MSIGHAMTPERATKSPDTRNFNSLTPIRPSKSDRDLQTPTQLSVNSNKSSQSFDQLGSSPTDRHPRLSFVFSSSNYRPDPERQKLLNEIDLIEQNITTNLQKINMNISKANSIIVDKLLPALDKFHSNSTKINNHVNHIKEFFENAANVNMLTRKDLEVQDETHVTDIDLFGASESNYLSDTSEIKNMNDRYKKNFSSSMEHSHSELGDSSSLLPPAPILPYLSTSDREESQDFLDIPGSTLNASFLKEVQINTEDASTAQTPTLKLSASDYRKSLGLYENKSQLSPLKGNKRVNSPEVTLTPESKRKKLMSDLIEGYESPPWGEPPLLEYEKFLSPQKKTTIAFSPHGIVDLDDSDKEVSIRFPMSPKYGGGGKLLRSEEGRELALDFARSEMQQNHPILMLQRETANVQDAPVNEPTITGTFYTIDTTSTTDVPPQITSAINPAKNSGFTGDNETEKDTDTTTHNIRNVFDDESSGAILGPLLAVDKDPDGDGK